MLTYKESIDLSCVARRCCSSLHNKHFVALQKYTLRKESSVRMKIFISLEDLHAKLPGLTAMLTFSFDYIDDKVWNIPSPVIHMQSITVVVLIQECYPASRASISSLSSLFDVVFLSVGFARKYQLCLGLVIFLLIMREVFMTTQKYLCDIFININLTLEYYKKKHTFEGLWNGTLVRCICSKDSHNGTHDGTYQKRINRSNLSKSAEGLEFSPSSGYGTSKKCQTQAKLAYTND